MDVKINYRIRQAIGYRWKDMRPGSYDMATRISLNTMNVVGGMGDEPTGFTTPREHMDALNKFVEVVRDV